MTVNNPDTGDAIVQISDLDFAYNGQRVLESVNLTVCEGRFYCHDRSQWRRKDDVAQAHAWAAKTEEW